MLHDGDNKVFCVILGNMEYRELRYLVKKDEDGITAGEIMREKMLLSSREVSRCKLFDDGVMCCDNGIYSPLRVIGQLRKGQELVVRLYEDNENAGDIVPVDGPIDIVYEDEDFIVLNKPGDMVIHPSYAHYMDSLSNYLAGYYKRTLQEHVVRTVGRLDRETSGLVIFAKNRHSAALLGNQKENMSRRKEYLAICEGFFDKKDGTVDAPIRQKPDERMIREVHPHGKEAIPHFHVEKQYDDYALVRLVLDTGRTHQIRVHMAYIGHPLVGDNFYGNKEKTYGLNRAALHAERISFIHPINIEEISLSADIPEDMKKLL